MNKVFYILLTLNSIVSYGQISGYDSKKGDSLINNFRNHIDSTRHLTNGAKISYISDTLFKGIILTLKNGEDIEIDLRYKNNTNGYTELGVDFERYVLLKYRGDGSGNDEQLRVISKKTGEDKWLGNYPFYLDMKSETGFYTVSTDSSSQIVVHDFMKGETETYSTPNTRCQCCGCFEVVHFDSEKFTIKFIDPEDKLIELEIKRENQ